MATSRAVTASLFLSLLLLHLNHAKHAMGMMNEAHSPVTISPAPATPAIIDCGEACKVRCQKSSRPNLCNRACGTCCAKCSCVPPGTSGNYQNCPCYFSLTTRGGIRKCP